MKKRGNSNTPKTAAESRKRSGVLELMELPAYTRDDILSPNIRIWPSGGELQQLQHHSTLFRGRITKTKCWSCHQLQHFDDLEA